MTKRNEQPSQKLLRNVYETNNVKQFIKKAALWFNHGMFVFLLFALPATFLLSFTFTQPHVVKNKLEQSGLYKTMSVMIADSSAKSLEVSTASYGLSGDAVQEVSRSVFSADKMQSLSEDFVTTVFRWLEGDSSTLVVAVDMEESQKEFMLLLSQKLLETIEKKPICTVQQLQQISSSQVSVLQAPCRPSTFDEEKIRSLFVQDSVGTQVPAVDGGEVADATELMQQANLTPEPVLTNEIYGISVPVLFDVMKNSFYIVLGLLMVTMIFLYLLLSDRRKYASNIAKPLLTTGILLSIYGMLSAWVISQKLLSKIIPGEQGVLTDTVVHTFTRSSIEIVLVFAGVYIISAAVLLIILHRTKKPTEPPSTETSAVSIPHQT